MKNPAASIFGTLLAVINQIKNLVVIRWYLVSGETIYCKVWENYLVHGSSSQRDFQVAVHILLSYILKFKGLVLLSLLKSLSVNQVQ